MYVYARPTATDLYVVHGVRGGSRNNVMLKNAESSESYEQQIQKHKKHDEYFAFFGTLQCLVRVRATQHCNAKRVKAL